MAQSGLNPTGILGMNALTLGAHVLLARMPDSVWKFSLRVNQNVLFSKRIHGR